jgi:hypothetical protein
MKNAWPNVSDFETSIDSLASTLNKKSPVSSETPRPSSFGLSGGEKNSLCRMWNDPSNFLRPKDPTGSGFVLRGYAGLPGRGDSPHLLPRVPEGEAGKAEVAGRLSLLHQAICLLYWPSLPGLHYSGCGPRVPSELEDGQSAGKAIPAGAAEASGNPGAEGPRHRRGFAPQRAYLPDCGQ